MEPIYASVDLRASVRRERNGLIALCVAFVVLAVPIFFLESLGQSVRLATISQAPSYVPIWIQQFWYWSGFLGGIEIGLGIWAFYQLARWGKVRRQIAARVQEDSHPAATFAQGVVPPPPRQQAGSGTAR